jgi:hypothetical protein
MDSSGRDKTHADCWPTDGSRTQASEKQDGRIAESSNRAKRNVTTLTYLIHGARSVMMSKCVSCEMNSRLISMFGVK